MQSNNDNLYKVKYNGNGYIIARENEEFSIKSTLFYKFYDKKRAEEICDRLNKKCENENLCIK